MTPLRPVLFVLAVLSTVVLSAQQVRPPVLSPALSRASEAPNVIPKAAASLPEITDPRLIAALRDCHDYLVVLAFKTLLEHEGEGIPQVDGCLAHVYTFAVGVKQDLPRARRLAQSAAARGDRYGRYMEGVMSLDGAGGQPEDLQLAARIFQELSDEGVPLATFTLARCYLNGWGVAKDDSKGHELMQLASDRGVPVAQDRVGFVPRTLTPALMACMRNYENVANNYDLCLRIVSGK